MGSRRFVPMLDAALTGLSEILQQALHFVLINPLITSNLVCHSKKLISGFSVFLPVGEVDASLHTFSCSYAQVILNHFCVFFSDCQ